MKQKTIVEKPNYLGLALAFSQDDLMTFYLKEIEKEREQLIQAAFERNQAKVEIIEKLREALRQYIVNFDNEELSDKEVKEWLDDDWIPSVRYLLKETEQA